MLCPFTHLASLLEIPRFEPFQVHKAPAPLQKTDRTALEPDRHRLRHGNQAWSPFS